MRARTSSESDREIIKIVYFKNFHTVENTSVLKYFQYLLNKDGMFSEKDTSGQERVHVKFFFERFYFLFSKSKHNFPLAPNSASYFFFLQ